MVRRSTPRLACRMHALASRSRILGPVRVAGLGLLAAAAIAGSAIDAWSHSTDTTRPEPTHGISLEGFAYPYPVRYFELESQRQRLVMAYMDVGPETVGGSTVVLLHGKNFSGAAWGDTARALAAAGHRVLVPDQIGFGRSSKPTCFHFSFAELVRHTHALLRHAGVERAIVVGHSMGGMLAVRFALDRPEVTERLVLVNPIGLEDWKAKGVPHVGVDAWYQAELAKDRDAMRKYQLETYYHGQWRPEYDRWVDMLAGMISSPEYPTFAWIQATTTDMAFSQPVVHELPRLRAPVLLIIGQLDRTALGKDAAPPDVRKTLGDYPALGRAAKAAIPRATLVELEGVGHVPQLEAPERFLEALVPFLRP